MENAYSSFSLFLIVLRNYIVSLQLLMVTFQLMSCLPDMIVYSCVCVGCSWMRQCRTSTLDSATCRRASYHWRCSV